MENIPSPIAIVGASGRVASRVIPILANEFSFKLGDLRSSTDSVSEIHSVDLLKPESIIPFLKGTSCVIHFAIASYTEETVSPTQKEEYHQQMLKVNVAGTYNLLEAARLAEVERVIYISSLTVAMGAKTDFSEDRPPCPIDLYACTKLFGENVAELYSRTYGMTCTSLRLGQPFPIGLAQEVLRSNPAFAPTFVTITDVARAVRAALTSERKGYGAYNVVSPTRGDRISYQKGLEIGFQPQDHWQEWSEPST